MPILVPALMFAVCCYFFRKSREWRYAGIAIFAAAMLAFTLPRMIIQHQYFSSLTALPANDVDFIVVDQHTISDPEVIQQVTQALNARQWFTMGKRSTGTFTDFSVHPTKGPPHRFKIAQHRHSDAAVLQFYRSDGFKTHNYGYALIPGFTKLAGVTLP